MPTLISQEMMREIIVDHYKSPLNKKTPEDTSDYLQTRMNSDSCIDDFNIFVKIENEKIADACFDGIGCAISTASTDILCELIKGKTWEEAQYIMTQYENMIFEKEYDDSVLEELNAFVNTHKQASRIKCATIAVGGLNKIHEETYKSK